MLKQKRLAKFLIALVIFQTVFFLFSTPAAIAKADDLIIDDNGAIVLVITGNSVLAVSTDTTNKTTATPAPATAPTAAPAPQKTSVQKVVPVAPANSESKVKISPNTTSDKKMRITIETTTPKATNQTTPATTAPKPGQNTPSQTATPTTAASPSNVQTVEKTVDNVILRGADKQPVLSIKPNQSQNNEVNIEQQNVNVSTNLPIQIDTKSHAISVQTTSGTQQVSVLPDQALSGAQQKVGLNPQTQNVTSSVDLTSDRGQAVYTVNQTRKGKLLGIDVSLPSQVKISAQTGKTVSVWQSPVSILFGFLIR